MDLIKLGGIDRDTDHHAVNEFVHLWCTCFAQAARLICDTYNVATDEFERIMHEFMSRIREDLRLAKWLQSERQKKDIGIDGLRDMIVVMCDTRQIQAGQSTIRERITIALEPHSENYSISLSMSFPNLEDPTQEPHVEWVHFPLSAKQGDSALAKMCE